MIWKDATLRFRSENRRRLDRVPLAEYLIGESASDLALGKHPGGASIGAKDFVISGQSKIVVKVQIPKEMIAAQLAVDVELDFKHGPSRIVRCRIADGAVEGETAAEVGATSALLGNPEDPGVERWQSDVAAFARWLPEVSQREPAPSDRDPIPYPFDSTYNKPERNYFHTAIKYHRDDRFLYEKILDDEARKQLDDAWTDLLTSFEYHDLILQFAKKKFGIAAQGVSSDELAPDSIRQLSGDVMACIERLQAEFASMRSRVASAESGHIEGLIKFAERAWRRPLSGDEANRLRVLYSQLRVQDEIDHAKAVRAVLARILVAPAFLYLAKPTSAAIEAISPLNDWDLASRLSYFLWSSPPDDELRTMVASGQLQRAENMEAQSLRMLRDPKARRFATEFFGQWFGFYRFEDFRGIDSQRFPEFDDSLRATLHDEAVSFFEFSVRDDRPIDEILFADYSFLNSSLAQHYRLENSNLPALKSVKVEGMSKHHRGGLLGLGAIHAVTSAPLRTSAVKRGDWILRRVLGTPVPPPPADVGSIAADDVHSDGLTVRKRLEAHRTDESCRNCHSRIDPLGFALEHFDPIGRWRTEYRDGQAIDSSGTLNDGTEINGMGGLREYLRREKEQFHRNLAGKLLTYALGRSEITSDRPLIKQLLVDMHAGCGISKLVKRIATSRQFTHKK